MKEKKIFDLIKVRESKLQSSPVTEAAVGQELSLCQGVHNANGGERVKAPKTALREEKGFQPV